MRNNVISVVEFSPYHSFLVYFAMIQSTFYRNIKGQQYLKEMYEINCYEEDGMFSHIQFFIIVLKIFVSLVSLI